MSEENVQGKEHWLVQFVRGATRPAVTIIFAGVFAHIVTQEIAVPVWQELLMGLVIGWWFVDRTVLHRAEQHNLTRQILEMIQRQGGVDKK